MRTSDIHGKDGVRASAAQRLKKALHGRNVINLRPHFRARHPWATVGIVVLIGVVSVWGMERIFTHGEVHDFFPATCLGTWQNTANAAGRPDTLANAGTAITPDNAAVFDATGTEIYCGGFVPADFSNTGTITSVGVTLVWQVGTSTAATSVAPVVPSTSSDAAATPAPGEVLGTSSSSAATSTAAASSSPASASAPDASSSSQPPQPSASTTDDGTTASPAPQPTPEPAQPDSSTQSSFIDMSGRLFAGLIKTAHADDVTTTAASATTTGGTPTDAASSSSEAADASGSVLGASTGTVAEIPPPPPDENFLSVSYSIDGQTWIELKKISVENWPNLTLAIPIGSWGDLANLQVRVEDIPTTQAPLPPVMLDGMFVEVQYAATAGAPPPPPVYTDFTTDKSSYAQNETIHVKGAPDGSSIEIYALANPNDPATAQNVFGVQLTNGGWTAIDAGQLAPGSYMLVNTFEPDTCGGYSLEDCRARSDFVSEQAVTVTSSTAP